MYLLHIFSNGTQVCDWMMRNCDNCASRGDCDLELAVVRGEQTGAQAARLGYRDPLAYNWRCGELRPIADEATHLRSLLPRPTHPMPLYRRLWRALRATWTFWIKPWDREDHDAYDSLRSPLLAWTIAWGIWHDAEIPKEPK